MECRYGFNNQEQDEELGDYYSFEYRVHDARLGRFLSVDPLRKKYPYYSVYHFAANSPIIAVDIEGLESSSDPNPTTESSNYVVSGISEVFYTPDGGTIELPQGTEIINGLGDQSTGSYNNCSGNGCSFNTQQGAVFKFKLPNGQVFESWFDNEGYFTEYKEECGLNRLSYSQTKTAETYTSLDNPFGGDRIDNLSGLAAVSWETSTATKNPVVIAGAAAVMAVAVVSNSITINVEVWDLKLQRPYVPIGGLIIDGIPFSIPLDYTTKNGYTTTFDPDGYVTLFRGVSNSHRDFDLAKTGTVVPLPGGASAEEHCKGNQYSNHTSWTFNPWIALSFATDEGRNSGIVLIKVFKYSEIISRYSDICLDYQWEIQIEGTITGCIPIHVTSEMMNKPIKP